MNIKTNITVRHKDGKVIMSEADFFNLTRVDDEEGK